MQPVKLSWRFTTGFRSLVLLAGTTFLAAALGCGGKGIPVQTKNTAVTLVATETENDSILAYQQDISTLVLTDASGKTVSLVSNPIGVEFHHLNSTSEPILSVSVPAGVYTSATLTTSGAWFNCAVSRSVAGFYAIWQEAKTFTVALPVPLSVGGMSQVLSLDLLGSESANFATCASNSAWAVTPSLKLSTLAAQLNPTNSGNGKMLGLQGMIASVDVADGSMVVDSGDGSNYTGDGPTGPVVAGNSPKWAVALPAGIALQGVSSATQLQVGMALEFDANLQPDGTLAATRVQVYDPSPANISFWSVPVLRVVDFEPTAIVGGREAMGPELTGLQAGVDYSQAIFGVSQELGDLTNLPFTPRFAADNFVAGQVVAITFHETTAPPSTGSAATTVTLVPQTIDGTVTSISHDGGYTVYTVELAAYDPFPALAVQKDQTTLLTSPSTVLVYAGSETQQLDAAPIATGTVFRFHGLVFNDGGALRMVCNETSDGVAL